MEEIPGFSAPVRRALTEPILLGGAPRSVAILNGTLAAALGLGLRLGIVGIVLWAIGHLAAVWAARRDPLFVEVINRAAAMLGIGLGSVINLLNPDCIVLGGGVVRGGVVRVPGGLGPGVGPCPHPGAGVGVSVPSSRPENTLSPL